TRRTTSCEVVVANTGASGGDIFAKKKPESAPRLTIAKRGGFSFGGHRRPRLFRTSNYCQFY
ncbi:MAG: hypothetical protein Q9M48_07820, partial [Rhodobacterales bacterium]|nr:hypothetical protein [Rhodobacterales bacterium]